MSTLQDYLKDPPKLVGPDYNIYHYTGGIYKVVKFKAPRSLLKVVRPSKPKSAESTKKPDSSLSRARRNVLELALCNDWAYFCTFTLDKSKYDRHNLDVWKNDFTQWLRDQRKKYRSKGIVFDCPFLLVPELHRDGAWHMHGLMTVDPSVLIPFYCEREQGMFLPDKLVNGGYFDWPDYRKKFGFCSLGKIKNKVAAAFYVSKYITEDLQSSCDTLGVHSYIPSRGLNRATLHGSIYGDYDYLNNFLVNDYQFVRTGMTKVSDKLDWTFGYEYMDFSHLEAMEVFSTSHIPDEDIIRFEEYFEGVQQALEGFE